jgi:hypothetical protein
MHIPLHTKTVFQYMLAVLCIGTLLSCGGESSGGSSISSTTNATKKRDLVSYMYTDETSQPLKGNGIWNYSVATDYYYGTMSTPQSPSLAVDLPANPDANIEYVFAAFISLSIGVPPANSAPAMISDTCPAAKDSTVPMIAYYALPLVKSTIYPAQPNPLGECVDGKLATAYYAGINKDAPLKVVPVAEYATNDFPALIASASSTTITNIATALAQEIVNDPSAYGLAIDNEKGISSYNPDPTNQNSQQQQNEELFFGVMAQILGQAGKYLFLFDANKSANYLYTTNKYKNVVILAPLYDLDNSDPAVTTSTAYNPDQLASPYKASVNSMALGTLSASTGVGQSVMFVVPASATSTIWDYEMVYNYPYPTGAYSNPIYNAPPPGILANSNGQTCASPFRNELTNTVLNNLVDPSHTVAQFFAIDNCYIFNNPTPLNSYFSTALDAITTAINTTKTNGTTNANYLGAALYAWRINGQNDINGMKSYYSVYTYSPWKGLKLSYQEGPPDIQTSTWGLFNTWAASVK